MNPDPPHAGSGTEPPADPTRSIDGQGPTQDLAVGPALSVGSMFGGYRIEGLLGYGGAGIVYRARQNRPDREVALKVIRPGAATIQGLKRLELEAEVLGRLQHPGIAQVYEAGTADTPIGSQPFFAMELVQGDSLTVFASKHNLGTRQARFELFAKVCEAVQHAHSKGIIHRDLKPSNILVTAEGQPKVLDFGVARVTDHDVQMTTIHTHIGQLIGTVPYMSPEQVSGDSLSLDTLSDVYALGVILYELLTGRMPYDLSKKLIHEAARIIREDEPTRLSSIDRLLRGDVETIVAKAMEKEKDRRYQGASDLASDITRYLRDEPIVARPASAGYQFRKFATRNKALVGGVVTAFILLMAGLIGTGYGLVRAEEQTALAAKRARELGQVAEFQAAQLSGIDVPQMGVRLRRGVLEQARTGWEQSKIETSRLDERTVQLERLLEGADFTGLARTSLDENIFESALWAVKKQFVDQLEVKASLLQTLASTMSRLGLLERATAPQEEALMIRRKVLGDEHPHTLDSIHGMAQLLLAQDRMAEAEQYYREAVENSLRALDNARGSGWRAKFDARYIQLRLRFLISNLVFLLRSQGRMGSAEPLFQTAVNGLVRANGFMRTETHGEAIADARLAHGVALADLGRHEESEQELLMAESILSIRRPHSGCLSALVALYTVWDKAEPGKQHDSQAVLWQAKLDALPMPPKPAP